MFSDDSQPEFGTLLPQRASPAELDRIHTEASPFRVFGTFEDFERNAETVSGVLIEDLAAGSSLTARTKHSCYRFEIVDPATRLARVTGGSLFSEPTDVRIAGATVGGCMIKAGWIGVGLRVELTSGGRRITTSRVKFLTVDDAPVETTAA